MKTAFALLPFFFSLAYSGLSQQLPIFTQCREYQGIINPASVPNDFLWYERTLSFGASYRRQWITADNGPSTQVLRGDYLLERRTVSPIFGGYLLNDKADRVGMTGAYIRTAMLFTDNPLERGISVGLHAGIVRYGLDLRNPRVANFNDPRLYDNKSKIFPDAGLGLYAYTTFYNGHLIYGGLSIPQIMNLDLNYGVDDTTKISLLRVRHYYGTAGYKIPLRDEFSFLEFSVWARYVNPLPPSFDFNARFQLDSYLYIGAGLGTNGYAHLEAGLLFGEEQLLRVGMGADFPFSEVSAYYGSSLEVNVNYAIDR